jgi:hypothetical protein
MTGSKASSGISGAGNTIQRSSNRPGELLGLYLTSPTLNVLVSPIA